MAKKGISYVGTSGWHYAHWQGTFYPDGLKSKDFIKYYQEKLNTVEINNSFYRLPSEKTFANWEQQVPDDFIFAVKGSRFITHIKKLKSPIEESINLFLEKSAALKDKLGPILFQLTPTFKNNPERLNQLVSKLPNDLLFTIEFRNPEWYNEETQKILTRHNIAFCWYELAFHISPDWVTADFVYIRLHGPGEKYQGNYNADTLNNWAAKIKDITLIGKDVYCYFDNDQNAYAANNAIKLKELLSQ